MSPCRSRTIPGTRRSTRADKARLPHIHRLIPVESRRSQYLRSLRISNVESQQEGLLHDVQVGPLQQPAQCFVPAVGWDDMLAAPQGVVGADQEIDARLVVGRLE